MDTNLLILLNIYLLDIEEDDNTNPNLKVEDPSELADP